MNRFLRCVGWAAAVLLGSAAQAAVFASAPEADGSRLVLECGALPDQGCRLQQQDASKRAAQTTSLKLDQPTPFVDLLRQAVEQPPQGLPAPAFAVKQQIRWSDCRDDGKHRGVVAVCPVGNWDSGTLVVFLRPLCDRCKFGPFVVTTAGAPPFDSETRARVPTPGAAMATQLTPAEGATAQGLVRTDGVYATALQGTAEGSRYRGYVRLFTDGSALQVNLVGPPELACKRLAQGTPASPGVLAGQFEQKGAQVVVTVAFGARTVRFDGRFNERDQLVLEYELRQGMRGDVYEFYECPADAARQAGSPSTLNPRKP